ncbi:alpha/beta hydrolase [Pyxidicoccus fallax]|uniref:Alpha/beta hydrolase n=1 Tax=Pyxidicoccus fallax TaxID=394095 RepID=A0A848LK30_9BACT|nr:alpha/beta hydrolase [Pyxidicoccus fallax]NMO18034.1 alpha/beta hydrolase [Pyxidicoccus fallax]NPC78616.1 alpha/beta hydrolase [Pyxidicoccus fallax]
MRFPPQLLAAPSSPSGVTKSWRPTPIQALCTPLIHRMRLSGLDWDDIRSCLTALGDAPLLEEQALWHDVWTSRGHVCEARSMEAAVMRERATQRRMLLRSAACHHFAQLPFFDNPEAKFMTRRRVTRLFECARPLLPHEVQSLRVPHGDFTLPAYLLLAGTGECTPCVLLVNDLGSAKEVELHALAEEFLAHGVSVLLFDGPGQGELSGLRRLPVAFEQVVTSVLDGVSEHPRVDSGRLGICGLGHGGYLAARAAALLPERLRACISISGGYDHAHYARLPELVRAELKYAYCERSADAMERLARSELSLREVPRLDAPLLVVQDTEDPTWPRASSLQLLEWARGDRDFLCTTLEQLASARLGPWMARALPAAGA